MKKSMTIVKIEIRMKEPNVDWANIKPSIHTVLEGDEYTYCKNLANNNNIEVRYNYLNSLQGHYVNRDIKINQL